MHTTPEDVFIFTCKYQLFKWNIRLYEWTTGKDSIPRIVSPFIKEETPDL